VRLNPSGGAAIRKRAGAVKASRQLLAPVTGKEQVVTEK
jgi:hypothetical protein